MAKKRVSIIGCGYVADFYMYTLPDSQFLEVAGLYDRDTSRAKQLADKYGVPRVYESFEALLADGSVEIVLNLTNPRSHYEITKTCLERGKHVYSEKPLAMEFEEAKELAELAKARGLQLSSAPCNLLSESAQTMWKELRKGTIGKVRLAYAELDEDLVHKGKPDEWHSSIGTPWPYIDEYEVGCTLEHAGYYVSWLAAFFGPARRVVSFGSCLLPPEEKAPGAKLDPPDTPDFTVACIEFDSGVVARITCSIVGPKNHSLTLIGDEGVLLTENCWNYSSPVRARQRAWNNSKYMVGHPFRHFLITAWSYFSWFFPRFKGHDRRVRDALEVPPDPRGDEVPLVRKSPPFKAHYILAMNFSRGIEEMARAIDEQRESRLSADFSLHIAELVLAIHRARKEGLSYEMTTRFEPVEPMPWAQ